MSDTITYANFTLIEKFLDAGQKDYARAKVADLENDLFVVASHFLHNDGPDIRTRFVINEQGNSLLVDVPVDVFNMFPTYTPTAAEETEAAETLDAKKGKPVTLKAQDSTNLGKAPVENGDDTAKPVTSFGGIGDVVDDDDE